MQAFQKRTSPRGRSGGRSTPGVRAKLSQPSLHALSLAQHLLLQAAPVEARNQGPATRRRKALDRFHYHLSRRTWTVNGALGLLAPVEESLKPLDYADQLLSTSPDRYSRWTDGIPANAGEAEKKEQAKLTGEIFEATPGEVKIPGRNPTFPSWSNPRRCHRRAAGSHLRHRTSCSVSEPEKPVSRLAARGGGYRSQRAPVVLAMGTAAGSLLAMGRGWARAGKSAASLDTWRQVAKKAVVVSEKQGLIEDAKRDYGDTAATANTEILPQAKVKASEPIERQANNITPISTREASEKREATEADKRIGRPG